MIKLHDHAVRRLAERHLQRAWSRLPSRRPTRPPLIPMTTQAFRAILEARGHILRVAHRPDSDDILVLAAFFDRGAKRPSRPLTILLPMPFMRASPPTVRRSPRTGKSRRTSTSTSTPTAILSAPRCYTSVCAIRVRSNLRPSRPPMPPPELLAHLLKRDVARDTGCARHISRLDEAIVARSKRGTRRPGADGV
jgi:hypothetical protein